MAKDSDLETLRKRMKPFDDAEIALVRSVVSETEWLSEPDESALRYALGLARLTAIRTPRGDDVHLDEVLAPFRDEIRRTLVPALCESRGPDRHRVVGLVKDVLVQARGWRARVAATFEALPREAVDREVCERMLVLVAGGGGGVVWNYLGAFELLEQYGLRPRLLSGTSMGAVLLLFRARRPRWHTEELESVLRPLAFTNLFRFLKMDSRFGLPAALHLALKAAVGEFLLGPEGRTLTLDELAIPLYVAVTGIRNGALPRDPSYYEHLLDRKADPKKFRVTRYATEIFRAVGELMMQKNRLARIYLGADDETRTFDAVDAVGFSSALPGVVHYDIGDEDDRMKHILERLFRRHDLFRLVDGGLVDNLPARVAFEAVQRGVLGSRNGFVLALEGFGPKLSQPLWYGLEQLASQNVARNLAFVHHRRSFENVLSPAEIFPSRRALRRAILAGKSELHPDMAFVARMCRPFPPI